MPSHLSKMKLPQRKLWAEIKLVVFINIYIRITRQMKFEMRPQRNIANSTNIILNR